MNGVAFNPPEAEAVVMIRDQGDESSPVPDSRHADGDSRGVARGPGRE